MFQRVLKQVRDKVRNRQYGMALHAEEEMSDDELTIFDIERGILTGEIVERQKDAQTGEWKYLAKGHTVTSEDIVVVDKISFTGKSIIVTVYHL